ncbi:glycoside hydrolase family 15 protein [Saliphagus sp. GCM10025308]
MVSLGARVGTDVSALETEVALGFATDADVDAARAEATRALERGFETIREDYVDSWRSYLGDLDVPESVADDPDRRVQYDFAAMTLKAVEDKTFVGAGLASPSVPWGTGVEATEAADYGYNFVWSRDLYQVSTAFEAMGDVESAIDATAYLFRYQLEDDGFLPQNTYLEGTTRWGGEQLDNISFPIVMAYQLANRHGHGLESASYDYDDMRTIAEYILRSGPDSEQERWEEEAGYSPSTIAAEIAGLVCAAWFADRAGADEDAIRYLAVADDWSRGVEEWCATDSGTDEHDAPYYVRVSADGRPDEANERTLANGGPTLDERDIVDAGFLGSFGWESSPGTTRSSATRSPSSTKRSASTRPTAPRGTATTETATANRPPTDRTARAHPGRSPTRARGDCGPSSRANVASTNCSPTRPTPTSSRRPSWRR